MKKPSTKLLDLEFSRFIRERDNFTCQRCGTQHTPNSTGLHASHFIGRANRSTRWDPQNVDAMCNGCHQYLETHKATTYRAWKQDQLGEQAFLDLIRRSQQIKKWKEAELIELRSSWKAGVPIHHAQATPAFQESS